MTYPAPAMSLKEFRCAKCGYGISLSGALPACPMCQTTGWNPRRYELRGAEMAAEAKPPEKGVAEQRAQRELTTRVGTPLVRQEKKSRRRLFGGRPKS